MEYKTVLKVSDSELYHALLESALGEAKQATGKEINENDLKGGYKYKKRMDVNGKSREITTHIKQPVTNQKVHITVDYVDHYYSMEYLIRYIDKNETELTYIQSEKNEKAGFIKKLRFKSGMKKKFKKIENYIFSKRAK